MNSESLPCSGTQSKNATRNAVGAVIVTHYPDSRLVGLIASIRPQVEMLLIVDNSPVASSRILDLLDTSCLQKILLIKNETNMGLGTALNIGLEKAFKHKCKWLLTLDQDTTCYPNMVQTLLQIYEACDPKPAVIGSNYFDPRNGNSEAPICAKNNYYARKTVITSGSLITLAQARSLGPFRADYFIDQIDHEYCLRARRHDRPIVITREVLMEHSVGNANGARVPFLGQLPNHPPLRKYYIVRNSMDLIREYWRIEPEWCLRRLVKLLLGLPLMIIFEKERVKKTRAFIAGLSDGIRGRLGPCHRAWLNPMNNS